MMAAITLTLIGMGDPRAPQIGYASAYALSAGIAVLLFLTRRRPGGAGNAIRAASPLR